MAESKKSSETGKKISDISAPKASPSGRPIIISSHPAGDDPMLNSKQDEQSNAAEASTHKKVIQPLKHDEEADEPKVEEDQTETETKTEVIPSGESDAPTSGEPEANAQVAPAADSADAPVKPEDSTDVVDSGEDDSANGAEPEDEPEGSETAETGKGDLPDKKKEDKKAEEEAKAAEEERRTKYEQMIARGKYFVPINAVKKRRATWATAIAIIVLLVLAVTAIDLSLDAGWLHLGGVKPVTDFFQTTKSKTKSRQPPGQKTNPSPFSGIPPVSGTKGQRETGLAEMNITIIFEKLGAYYAVFGYYPGTISPGEFVALEHSDGYSSTNPVTDIKKATTTPSGFTYTYTPSPAGCTTADKACQDFTLVAKDAAGNVVEKKDTFQ